MGRRTLTRTPAKKRSHVVPLKTGKANSATSTPKPTRQDRSSSKRETEGSGEEPTAPPAPRPPQRTPLGRRRFHPDQHRRILDLFRVAFDLDDNGLPPYLREDIAIPLRVGYSTDLKRRYNVPKHERKHPRSIAFGKAMVKYTESRPYRYALVPSEARALEQVEVEENLLLIERDGPEVEDSNRRAAHLH